MPTALPNSLPTDVESCHALIALLQEDLVRSQQQVDHLLRRLFGPSSERYDPNQLPLFEDAVAPPKEEDPEPDASPAKPKRKGHGRKRLSDELPRKRIVHDIPEEQKVCPCGRPRVVIGEDMSEQLDFTPASYYVIQHVRPLYSCTDSTCDCGVVQASKPPQPIEKGLAAPGLIAHVLTSKFCDHLPLHRQEGIFARHGIDLSRQTLCGLVIQSGERLTPLVAAMIHQVLQSKVVHTDDTPVHVQDPKKKRTTRKSYIWPYVGDAAHPYTVFDYTPTRSREGPEAFLNDFRGTSDAPRYLQCDAFAGYNGLFTNGQHVLEVACWAHSRRKFVDAKGSDPVRAHQALIYIGNLYAVERQARELDPVARLALRVERAIPILETFQTWLLQAKADVLPKSPMGMAIDYALSNWTALERYTTDADLAIDNNAAEQAIRAVALGRKNWLFFGSDRGGYAAAVHFSLIASARRHGLDPYAYLRDVLIRIPTQPADRIHELFPDNWKAATLEPLNC